MGNSIGRALLIIIWNAIMYFVSLSLYNLQSANSIIYFLSLALIILLYRLVIDSKLVNSLIYLHYGFGLEPIIIAIIFILIIPNNGIGMACSVVSLIDWIKSSIYLKNEDNTIINLNLPEIIKCNRYEVGIYNILKDGLNCKINGKLLNKNLSFYKIVKLVKNEINQNHIVLIEKIENPKYLVYNVRYKLFLNNFDFDFEINNCFGGKIIQYKNMIAEADREIDREEIYKIALNNKIFDKEVYIEYYSIKVGTRKDNILIRSIE